MEAASFGVPAVNIGHRQMNRQAADSVLHVPYAVEQIEASIRQALGHDFQSFARTCPNPYDPFHDGNNSLRIVQALHRALTTCTREQLCMKKFDTVINAQAWNTLCQGEA